MPKMQISGTVELKSTYSRVILLSQSREGSLFFNRENQISSNKLSGDHGRRSDFEFIPAADRIDFVFRSATQIV